MYYIYIYVYVYVYVCVCVGVCVYVIYSCDGKAEFSADPSEILSIVLIIITVENSCAVVGNHDKFYDSIDMIKNKKNYMYIYIQCSA